MAELIFVGGIDDPKRIQDGKTLSRNYNQGCRVYSSYGIATAITSSPIGMYGGHSGLYLVEVEDVCCDTANRKN